jgi:hypothetical protein
MHWYVLRQGIGSCGPLSLQCLIWHQKRQQGSNSGIIMYETKPRLQNQAAHGKGLCSDTTCGN